jgi:predicted NAD-dependent protein-ADP-ribosyltransferase YbiA (DUF1768 family)
MSAMKTYLKSDVAWFCTSDDPFWELSNMAGAMPIHWPPRPPRSLPNGRIPWNSSEQLYQATKYDTSVECRPRGNPNAEPNVRKRIRAATNARGAKMTQKCAVAAGLVRKDWEAPDEVRLKAMLWVLELKLFHNRGTFGKALKATGDLPIVEISTRDTFWGCKDDGRGNLNGENHLGLLLTDVRSRHDAILAGAFTYPEGLLLP